MLKISILFFFFATISISQANSNGDPEGSIDCRKCESIECADSNPEKCKSNHCIVCVNQQDTDNDALLSQILQSINAIKQDVINIKLLIGKLTPIIEPNGWVFGKILNTLALTLNIIGTFLLGWEFIVRKPALERKLEEKLRDLKNIVPTITMEHLQELLNDLLEVIDNEAKKVNIREAIEYAKELEKQKYGKAGLYLVFFGFVLQAIAIWV